MSTAWYIDVYKQKWMYLVLHIFFKKIFRRIIGGGALAPQLFKLEGGTALYHWPALKWKTSQWNMLLNILTWYKVVCQIASLETTKDVLYIFKSPNLLGKPPLNQPRAQFARFGACFLPTLNRKSLDSFDFFVTAYETAISFIILTCSPSPAPIPQSRCL